jgi:O-ureido-D-serine cyclo-ligase
MKCIIATCAPFLQDGKPLAPDDGLLLEALRAQGIDAEVVPWEARDYPWWQADLVKIASTWNYHLFWQAYQEWVQHIAAGTRLLNPPEAIRWNMEKGKYFHDLQRQGLPLIPTVLLRKGRVVDLAARLDEWGWDRCVLKPSVGANSFGCVRVCRGDAVSLAAGQDHLDVFLQRQDMLLQPFLSSIEAASETSHVFVNGTWSHAFVKSAFAPRTSGAPTPAGEMAARPPSAEVELAVRVHEAVQALLGLPLLYGRVDIVRDGQGYPRIMEVELMEPMLHLELGNALGLLTQAIIEACCARVS